MRTIVHSLDASTADFERLAEVLTSAITILEWPGWPKPLSRILRRYLLDVERDITRARSQPGNTVPLAWAKEATSAARGLLELAGARCQVPGPRYCNLRWRLEEIDRGLGELMRSWRG